MAFACRMLLALLLVGSTCTPVLAGTCSADSTCTACRNNNEWECTGCEAGYHLVDGDNDGYGWCLHSTCSWSDDYLSDWYGKMIIGSIVGFVATIVTTVAVSLPVCCGVMKDSVKVIKIIAIVCSLLALFCFFIPAIAGSASSDALIDDICDGCTDGCTEAEREDHRDHIRGFGVWVAYTYGFGFLVLIMGGITMCLSCCVCCPCCGPLQAAKRDPVTPVHAVQGQVVGQPQPDNNKGS